MWLAKALSYVVSAVKWVVDKYLTNLDSKEEKALDLACSCADNTKVAKEKADANYAVIVNIAVDNRKKAIAKAVEKEDKDRTVHMNKVEKIIKAKELLGDE